MLAERFLFANESLVFGRVPFFGFKVYRARSVIFVHIVTPVRIIAGVFINRDFFFRIGFYRGFGLYVRGFRYFSHVSIFISLAGLLKGSPTLNQVVAANLGSFDNPGDMIVAAAASTGLLWPLLFNMA